jgi:hypothetical protein
MERGMGYAPAPEFSSEVKGEIKGMNEEQVREFAEANKFFITEGSKKSRCVDGRYDGLEDFPAIAKPGGDAGDVMTAFGALNAMNLELDNEKVLEAVIEAVGGNENFRFHTDDHAEHDHAGAGMGCGHLKRAALEPDDYGLKQKQIDFIVKQLPHLIESGAHQEVLHGDHAEKAVVVVDSEGYGLKPLLQTEGGLEETFVYQKTLHQAQLDVLARKLQERLAEAGIPIEETEIRTSMDAAFAKQLGATLQRLAKGLPIYTVKIDSEGAVEVQA